MEKCSHHSPIKDVQIRSVRLGTVNQLTNQNPANIGKLENICNFLVPASGMGFYAQNQYAIPTYFFEGKEDRPIVKANNLEDEDHCFSTVRV